MKNQKGVTLTSLVVTIVVIFILAGVTITATTDVLYDSKRKSNITNLRLVQMSAESVFEEFDFNGIDTANMGVGASSSDLSKCNIDGSNTNWYKWNKETLELNGLDPEMLANDGDFFLINCVTNEVAISTGYMPKDGNKIYTLTDMLNND